MRVVSGIVVVAVLALLAFFAWVYSGGYDVAATRPHGALSGWLADTVKRQSVRVHARGVVAPSQAAGDGAIEEGARQYREDCQFCHGAPGIERSKTAQAMNPAPKAMVDEARLWKSPELFWVVKNGIRMTGMPAFGPQLADDRIWRVVAFLGQLPEMTPDRYTQLTAPPPPPAPVPEQAQTQPPAAEAPPPQDQPQPAPAEPAPAPQ
jgi:mono/diheme cytochrome c family protein